MSKIIIAGNPDFKKQAKLGEQCLNIEDSILNVAEFFCDTIQGEGVQIGMPAAFLRVQNCTQNCVFCDTTEVWRFGNPYSFCELMDLMDRADLPRKLYAGQHLVLTGGSPLLQQKALINFIDTYIQIYGHKPYIEIENECTLMPDDEMVELVDCWNNSPKLANSLNPQTFRFQPKILTKLSSLENSWFKFVISGEEDWKEIESMFLTTGLIRRDQIVLMPMGATRVELESNRAMVVEMAVQQNVRFSTREHIVIWDKKTGV